MRSRRANAREAVPGAAMIDLEEQIAAEDSVRQAAPQDPPPIERQTPQPPQNAARTRPERPQRAGEGILRAAGRPPERLPRHPLGDDPNDLFQDEADERLSEEEDPARMTERGPQPLETIMATIKEELRQQRAARKRMSPDDTPCAYYHLLPFEVRWADTQLGRHATLDDATNAAARVLWYAPLHDKCCCVVDLRAHATVWPQTAEAEAEEPEAELLVEEGEDEDFVNLDEEEAA